ncbi:MAG: T9SS type A sorting domain-containing protein [Bacteroidales bacterium]|nr:T9SS type A sorting domain-containing protein [Bacteroidales bacterium]
MKTTLSDWEKYPSYQEYLNKMNGFAANYPQLCELVDIGQSTKGKQLLAIKITNKNSVAEKPVSFYSAAIHGDEGAGFILMLRLIDYLLTHFESDEEINQLLNNSINYINPLANPDGFYYLNDSTHYGATRFNSNHVDLNRNFPDPDEGNHPDGNEWQPETKAFMQFMEDVNILLSANFHDGSELLNYPWDTWEKLHADNNWFIRVCRAYADTVHSSSPLSYFDDLDNGITNGYQWYTISGGRQDYVTYFLQAREVTVELSKIKSPVGNDLELLWHYNKQSLIQYLMNSLDGIYGKVTDAFTGETIKAAISVTGYDSDYSSVYSDENGMFYRMILPGLHNLEINASGYKTTYFPANVPSKGRTFVNAQLEPDDKTDGLADIYINSFTGDVFIPLSDSFVGMVRIEVYDVSGRLMFNSWLDMNYSGILEFNPGYLHPGVYIVQIINNTLKKRYKVIKR